MKICRELCDKTGGPSPLPSPPALTTLPAHCRHVRSRHERRALQRPPLRADPPTRAEKHRSRRRRRCRHGQDERGPDADGLPAAPARHGLGRALRVPRADARSGVPLPALRRPPLRRTDRLRRVWTHDRVVTAPRAELSPLVPRQVLLCRVSSGAAPPLPSTAQMRCNAFAGRGLPLAFLFGF